MSQSSEEKLRCISLILCSAIYRDEQSKNLILVGLFSDINAEDVPCLHHEMSALVTVSGTGTFDIDLTIENEEAKTEIAAFHSKGLTIEATEMAVTDLHVKFANIVFPNFGKYWLIFKSNGDVVQRRPFNVTEIKNKKKDNQVTK